MNPSNRSGLGALIGHTPLHPLRFSAEGITLQAKCEFLNPSGSIKDRLAKTIFDDAEKRGLLRPDSIILECSSGNTGVALAMMGAARGYKVTIVISEKASRERMQLIRQLGGEVITFPASGYNAGIELTQRMAAEDSRYFLPRQFENPLNAADHEHTTGREILAALSRPVDAFVAGYGTGGTLAGVSRALRMANPLTGIYAMEPAEAAVLLGEAPCCHFIEGVADGFVPPLLQGVKLDGSLPVSSADAMRMAQRLAREFGLLVGTSSGANVAAALQLARELGPERTVVTLLPDRAERYFSTRLFAEPTKGTSVPAA
ncbi:MAG TPA: cysteine synthase family protein [Phycisphaerae bacterium]|nr:cysteine synthase family protein [Phycisphaerae bacterium]